MIELLVENELHEALLLPGGGYARIYGPAGKPLGEPLATDAEGLLIAEIDLAAITIAKCFADAVEHYSRPDVTALLLNRDPQPTTVASHLPHRSDTNTAEAVDAAADLATES